MYEIDLIMEKQPCVHYVLINPLIVQPVRFINTSKDITECNKKMREAYHL